jgi:hypothetical protein
MKIIPGIREGSSHYLAARYFCLDFFSYEGALGNLLHAGFLFDQPPVGSYLFSLLLCERLLFLDKKFCTAALKEV